MLGKIDDMREQCAKVEARLVSRDVVISERARIVTILRDEARHCQTAVSLSAMADRIEMGE